MIGLVLFTLVIAALLVYSTRRPDNFPKGPLTLPVIGNLLHVNLMTPHASISKLNQQYGDVGIIVPFYKLVFLKSSHLIKELMENANFTAKPPHIFNKDRFAGQNLGIIFIDGELWNVNKRFALHNFRNFGMGKQKQEQVILQETEELINKITAINGQPFDIEPLVRLASISTTWTILGGEKIDGINAKEDEFVQATNNLVSHFSILGGVCTFAPFMRHIFPVECGYDKFVRDHTIMKNYVKETVHCHKKTRDPDNPRDFIDVYLNELDTQDKEADKYMFEDQLLAIVIEVTGAGSGTTSAQMTFAIMFLAIHQNVQQKLFDEISSTIGLVHTPCGDDKINLPYCQAVLSEVLRMRPSVPMVLPHQAIKDATLGPYSIPSGTLVFAHLEETFSDKLIWGDPKNFRPERFIDENGSLRTPDTFLPFGKGRRKCAGEVQAKLSSLLMLSSLVQKFQFKLPDDQTSFDTTGTRIFLLTPPKFKILAIPRTSS